MGAFIVVETAGWQTAFVPVRDDEAAVARAYPFLAGVTFARGEQPDYSVLGRCSLTVLIWCAPRAGDRRGWTVDEFVRARIAQFASGQLEEFSERETAHRTQLFGNVAHRFSRYSKHSVLAGNRTEIAGMISTQFVRTPDGWRISAMAWDDERPGLSVPVRFS